MGGNLFCAGQVNAGCFGRPACESIIENAMGGTVFRNVPVDVSLASVFWIGATVDGMVDATADLPGPGGVSLLGSFLAHN
jgi:hypothetical protein